MLSIFTDPHRRHLALTALVAAGLVAYLTGSVRALYGFDLAMLLALVGGLPIYLEAATSLARGKISANLAVSLAAVAALVLGRVQQSPGLYVVAAEVIFIMLIGEALENFAIERTRSGIAALLALRPQHARVRRQHSHSQDDHLDHAHEHHHGHGHHPEHDRQDQQHHAGHHEGEYHATDGHIHEHELIVPVEDIRPEDIVLVRPGDRIPVDGRVLRGTSSVDQSPITGESLPADKQPGDEVFAGTINLYGSLEIAVERMGEDTTLEQIIHLVEHAEETKAPTERLADRYASYFVPIVLVVALVTWLLSGDLLRAVAVLVVACPCALVLATPTAVAAGIGALVRRGVLVKGGSVLESLGRVRTVVFDKTGTLTLARLQIAEVVPTAGHSKEELLRLAGSVEQHSEHPIARLIVGEAAEQQISLLTATDFTAQPGLGAQATVQGQTVRVGSLRMLDQASIAVPEETRQHVERLADSGCTVVLVSRDEQVLGAIGVSDTVRAEARETVQRLRALGVRRIVMLTGDHRAAAHSVAHRLGIDEVESNLLPADKVAAVQRLGGETPPVAMVGDGINDAPSLVAADVGVAMAEIGTDVAVASADLVLVGDDLRKLADAVACGRRMLRIIWQNIIGFALLFNLLAVAAASLGWITPVVAAVVHQGSSLTVVLNSLRLLVDWNALRGRWYELAAALRRRRRQLATAAAVLAVVFYLLSGLHVVQFGQVAVVQHFGRIVMPVEQPGLHYRLPWPLGRHWLVRPDDLRRVEIGFRTVAGAFEEPPAYEWNVQHRGGRTIREPNEATVLAGDENLVDVNLVVHYRVADPVAALFALGTKTTDGQNKWDALVRGIAEAALREEMTQHPADWVLADQRQQVEEAIGNRVQRLLAEYHCGLELRAVCLADVHPPLEVVPAFRDVAIAREEKEARTNEAEAYKYQTEGRARGQAKQRVLEAEGYRADRTAKAIGRASRFTAVAAAYQTAGSKQLTRLRMYLETVQRVLAGRKKIIVDTPRSGGRRQVILGSGNLGAWLPWLLGTSQQSTESEQ